MGMYKTTRDAERQKGLFKKVFIKAGEEISRPKGKCRMCGHGGMILAGVVYSKVAENQVEFLGYCDNCWLCYAYPEVYNFEYECVRCGRFQTIPHPMYRYQPAPDAFPPEGGPTWACHRGCGDYTIWRIKADQVENVPAADKPASWN